MWELLKSVKEVGGLSLSQLIHHQVVSVALRYYDMRFLIVCRAYLPFFA